MRACARANGAMRFCPQAASGIISATPPSTDPFASRRSVTPISRGHANALGFQHPGAFSFWRSHKGIHTIKRDCIALPKHPGSCWPRQGNTAKAQGCAVPGCFGTGGDGCDCTGIGVFDVMSKTPMRNIDERSTAVRACMPVRCARHCRGVCRGSGDGVPRSDVSSVVEQQRKLSVAGSTPARLTWIAQTVRASVLDTECCGFDSRSNKRPVTSLHTGASPHQGTPRACPASLQRIATPTDTQRWCRRAIALEARGPAPIGIAMHRDADQRMASAQTAHRLRGIDVRGVSTYSRRCRSGFSREFFVGCQEQELAAEAAPTKIMQTRHPIHREENGSDHQDQQGEFPCSGPRGS